MKTVDLKITVTREERYVNEQGIDRIKRVVEAPKHFYNLDEESWAKILRTLDAAQLTGEIKRMKQPRFTQSSKGA